MILRSILNLRGKRILPIVIQSERAECGLACITMLTSFHGHLQDICTLRNRFPPSQHGATLTELIHLASAMNMTARAIRCDVHELVGCETPLILHWDFNHYVVLKKVTKRKVIIHDPAVGVREYPLAEVIRHFTGIALEMKPNDNFKTGDDTNKQSILSFFKNLNGLWPSVIQILVLSGILQLIALTMPFYMQLVVDEVLVKHDQDLLTILAIGFFSITIISVITQALRGWCHIYLSNQLSLLLGTKLFHHLLSLPVEYFYKRHMGDIVSRFSSFRPIQDFLTSSAVTVVLDGIMALTTLTLMLIYSPLLAGIVVLFLTLFLISQLAFYRPVKRQSHERISADARLSSSFMESIRSISAIKRANAEPSRESEWQSDFIESINSTIRLAKLSLNRDLIDTSLAGTANVLVIFVGAGQVLAGNLSIGMLYAFMAYRRHMTSAITSLIRELVNYLMLSLHLERLADIRNTPSEFAEVRLPLPIDGAIELSNVGYRFSESQPWVMKNLSFKLETGETMGITGPSGCGKSTLLAIIQSLIAVEKGDIEIDGMPLSIIGAQSLRWYSSSVLQEDVLLSGTIKSNISFNDAFVDMARVKAVAKMAEIDQDIARLPLGYDSQIGEMGTILSAGQQQRVLIARALYRQPRILLLDEGTAHLDRLTEEKVMKNIQALGITFIFVSHNQKLMSLADKVLIMKNGDHRLHQLNKISGTIAGA
ncbi:MAG: ATP-binding cassette subfamily B protein RaxB [Candidatus Azotimanducaceae bacterium]|jgi:ATP-binding cassette subfamily B protein RaxB